MLFGGGCSSWIHLPCFIFCYCEPSRNDFQKATEGYREKQCSSLNFSQLCSDRAVGAGALKYSKHDEKGFYFWAPLGRGGSGSSWLEPRRRSAAVGFSVVWENKL